MPAALPPGVPDAVLQVMGGALLTTCDGVVNWCNEAAVRLGQSIGTDLRTLPLSTVTPDGPARELRCPVPDGKPHHLRVTCRQLPPREGVGPELLYEVADVTAVRADRARADNYEWRLKHIEQLSKVGTWEWDLATGEVIWSPTLLSMFGLPAGSTLDYPAYRAMLYPDDVAMIESTLEAALENPAPSATPTACTWPTAGRCASSSATARSSPTPPGPPPGYSAPPTTSPRFTGSRTSWPTSPTTTR
ncbi:PAS domain-containing protein [Polymorphospora rubra]|uniref:PAS domain-containing protein n=1 Tax=Polymorphospora rubra TaxID=338584 RepID=A0A810MTR7_9ACTN|nr:PAS domain-containing protein [Polymorphospora rubra]BCJ63073.1 hypothetical protein Prubr_00940 [Polymorphospora rubra]